MEYNLHIIIAMIVVSVLTLAFCYTLYEVLQQIPKEYHVFPSWLVWLFIVPVVSIIIQWVMLPFGIPKSFKKYLATNGEALRAADFLFKIGLFEVVLVTCSIFAAYPYNYYLSAAGLVCWIVYWIYIVRMKKKYLTKTTA